MVAEYIVDVTGRRGSAVLRIHGWLSAILDTTGKNAYSTRTCASVPRENDED